MGSFWSFTNTVCELLELLFISNFDLLIQNMYMPQITIDNRTFHNYFNIFDPIRFSQMFSVKFH